MKMVCGNLVYAAFTP
nr:hypothetical protein [Vibrio vulnificus]